MDKELQELLIQWNAEKIKCLVIFPEFQKCTSALAKLNVDIYKKCKELNIDIKLLNL
jgi:hypothetical protein